MKKNLFIIITFLLMISNVKALTTKNGIPIKGGEGDSVSLYCSYSNGTHTSSFYFTKGSANDNGNNIDYSDSSLNTAESNPAPFFQDYSNTTLKNIGILDNNGNYDCPMFINYNLNKEGEIISWEGFYNSFIDIPSKDNTIFSPLNVSDSECAGKCQGGQAESNLSFTCNYLSTSGGQSLRIAYDDKTNVLNYSFPNGLKNEVTNPSLSEISIYQNCPDIFYNKKNNDIKVNYLEDISNCAGDLQCTKYFNELYANKDTIEYYCKNGICNYPKNSQISWEKVKEDATVTDPIGGLCYSSGIAKGLRFIGYMLLIAKILLPIFLIIMGSIDFGKAVLSNDGDALNRATRTFITRIIIAVSIFFIPTIVNFVFGGIVKNAGIYLQWNNCRICIFEPNSCNVS